MLTMDVRLTTANDKGTGAMVMTGIHDHLGTPLPNNFALFRVYQRWLEPRHVCEANPSSVTDDDSRHWKCPINESRSWQPRGRTAAPSAKAAPLVNGPPNVVLQTAVPFSRDGGEGVVLTYLRPSLQRLPHTPPSRRRSTTRPRSSRARGAGGPRRTSRAQGRACSSPE